MSNSLIGPRLLTDIKRTISIVRGDSGGDKIIPNQTRFEGGGGGGFRICTFTGAWNKTSEKTVTFRGVTTTPNTVTAVNLFANIASASGARSCAIAKDGAAWYLIAAECG